MKRSRQGLWRYLGEPDENPKHWQEDELSHHLKVIGGYAFKSDGFTDEGIPVLRIGNINSGHFLPVNMVYWPDDLALARYKVFPGDLVMSLTGTVGKMIMEMFAFLGLIMTNTI